MQMYYILIEEDHMSDFASVLYPGYTAGENRLTIGACGDDDTVQGAISVLLMEDQYDCDWLYVHPKCRGQGVANGLFDQVLDFISTTGLVYPVSASFEVTEEDRDLYGFFLSRDDVVVDYSHRRFYLQPEQIGEAEMLKKEFHTEYRKESYSVLNKEKKREVLEEIRSVHRILIPDISRWNEKCIPGLDMVLYEEDSVVGFIFFRKREDQYLELSYLYSRNPKGTMLLLLDAAKTIREKCPGYGIVFDAVSEEAEAISRKIFPENSGVCIYEAMW